jgi:hypothetical protein
MASVICARAIQPGQVGIPQFRAPQIRTAIKPQRLMVLGSFALQDRAAHVDAGQVGPAQTRPDEIGALQRRASQVCLQQISLVQVRACKVPEVGAFQIDAAQMRPRQVRARQVEDKAGVRRPRPCHRPVELIDLAAAQQFDRLHLAIGFRQQGKVRRSKSEVIRQPVAHGQTLFVGG